MTDAMEALVSLRNVSKHFGAQRVLDDVSFDVPRGEGVCLLGRSGTGKSVTLKHIIGLLQPDRGSVRVFGQETTGLRGRALADVRRRIGFLFQNAALFDSITVGENVAFPLRRHTNLPDAAIRSRAQETLASVGLETVYDRMPAELSGGMRKRAGLARAMVLDPPLLLVDEPSAGLDPITSAEIDELLLGLKQQGTTLLVVTHNIPSARAIGDTLILLSDGRVAAHGSVQHFEDHRHPLVQSFMHSASGG